MKITKHISFFFIADRIQYLNTIIDETNTYKFVTDIFIHTNNPHFNKTHLNNYSNGNLCVVYHDLSGIHPYYLTWMCRGMMKRQMDDYDIFMYIEDDILVPNKAIEYWINYTEQIEEDNYNLGFLRIERDNKNEEFITDLKRGEFFYKQISIKENSYCVNDINPYCAFWIYNKKEFKRFANSEYYDINNIDGYKYREGSAIGLHGLKTNWFKATVIPLIHNSLHDDCKIYHLPNNYARNEKETFGKVKFANNFRNISSNSNLVINSSDTITPMCVLGAECNTVKSPFALNAVCCAHRKGYTGVYSLLFSQMSNKDINFAEIGIEAGASLMLWSKWFRNANIYAFELDDNKINNCKNMNIQNVVYNKIDVSDESNLNWAFSRTNVLFDIIIDDSSHIIEHQNNIINNSAKFLKSGGILIIEDIQRDTNITTFKINPMDWHYYTFITCDHYNRHCSNNDKILYLVKL